MRDFFFAVHHIRKISIYVTIDKYYKGSAFRLIEALSHVMLDIYKIVDHPMILCVKIIDGDLFSERPEQQKPVIITDLG
jgi:hypothetical protein